MVYNIEGLPILANSAVIKYQNGKISTYGKKIYTYADSATTITWQNEKYYAGIEWKYVYKENALTRTEYKNNELTGDSTYIKYNADMMRQDVRGTYHWKTSYYTSTTIDYSFYE